MQEIEKVIEIYSSIRNIESILLIGSRATPFYDEHSDYDLYIIYSNEKPSRESRYIFGKMTGVKDFDLKPEENIRHDEWIQTGETFTFENIKIDSGYQSLDFLKAVIQGVVVEGKTSLDEISFRPYSIPGLIEESRILFDRTTKAQKLKEQTRPFPDKLKKSLIVEGKTIISESLIDMADYCKRSIGNDAFIFHLWRVTQGFSEILFALNNKYNPMSKRIEKYYENLELKPIDFKERFERILEGPFNQEGRKRTVKEFEVIFQELMEIVNLKMSELHEK